MSSPAMDKGGNGHNPERLFHGSACVHRSNTHQHSGDIRNICVPGVFGLKPVRSKQVTAAVLQAEAEKLKTPDCLLTSSVSPPCLKINATAEETRAPASTLLPKTEEPQSIFLPLFLPEEFSCHDFHDEGMDFYDAPPKAPQDQTDLAQGWTTTRLHLKPRSSPVATLLVGGSLVELAVDQDDLVHEDILKVLHPSARRKISPDNVCGLPILTKFPRISEARSPSELLTFAGPVSQLRRPIAHRNMHVRTYHESVRAPVNGAVFMPKLDPDDSP